MSIVPTRLILPPSSPSDFVTHNTWNLSTPIQSIDLQLLIINLITYSRLCNSSTMVHDDELVYSPRNS